jgi:hypothetical protein
VSAIDVRSAAAPSSLKKTPFLFFAPACPGHLFHLTLSGRPAAFSWPHILACPSRPASRTCFPRLSSAACRCRVRPFSNSCVAPPFGVKAKSRIAAARVKGLPTPGCGPARRHTGNALAASKSVSVRPGSESLPMRFYDRQWERHSRELRSPLLTPRPRPGVPAACQSGGAGMRTRVQRLFVIAMSVRLYSSLPLEGIFDH